jgi:hypothetical protein
VVGQQHHCEETLGDPQDESADVVSARKARSYNPLAQVWTQ